MKIAQVVCVFPPYKGGMGEAAYNFALILNKLGQQVTVFTPDYGQNNRNKPDSFSIIYLKTFLKYGNGAFVPQLLGRLKDFDVIHLHYPFYGGSEVVWLSKILHGKKIKLAIHYHMDILALPIISKALSLPSIAISSSLFRKADAITCASLNYIKCSNIKDIFEKYTNKFFEIPFGVDIGKYKPLHNGFGASQKFSKDMAPLNILFVGGLDKAHYFKGVDNLLKAVARLEIKNWQLNIVGDGDLRQRYENHSQELGIAQKVNFTGKIDNGQLIKFYQNADVLVLPSINSHEAFGLVLLEAMACGVPVIASDLPGVRSVFNNGVQGLLFKPNNVYEFRDKIEQILANKEERVKMGSAGRKLVKDKYNWQKAGEKLELLYKNLI